MNYEERDPFDMDKPIGANGGDVDDPDARYGPGPYLMGADTLIGNDVFNADGEDLGEIEEIMLDMRSGSIAYAVLAFGGVFGMGEKLFAVPWRALVLDTAHKRFILNVDKDRLKDAPGFDKGQWPNMADQSWAREIHDYYDVKPDSSRGAGLNLE